MNLEAARQAGSLGRAACERSTLPVSGAERAARSEALSPGATRRKRASKGAAGTAVFWGEVLLQLCKLVDSSYAVPRPSDDAQRQEEPACTK